MTAQKLAGTVLAASRNHNDGTLLLLQPPRCSIVVVVRGA